MTRKLLNVSLIGMTDPTDNNHCQRDTSDAIVPLKKVEQRKRRHTEENGSEEGEGPQHWLGPVADTVLVDFLFYGLFVSVPVLMLWIFFGRWWVFRNFEWIALGVGIWFVLVLGWRRKRESP